MAFDIDRAQTMATMFREGRTLQQIGDVYRLTRERVRQIIKRMGVVRNDGGVSLRGAINRAQRRSRIKARRDARYMAWLGCDYETALDINGGESCHKDGTIVAAYHNQKNAAKYRGIAWELTLVEWLVVWELSGHLSERGRGADKYVMARKGDEGPYALDNVYITTCAQNGRDYQSRRHGKDYTAANDSEAANG